MQKTLALTSPRLNDAEGQHTICQVWHTRQAVELISLGKDEAGPRPGGGCSTALLGPLQWAAVGVARTAGPAYVEPPETHPKSEGRRPAAPPGGRRRLHVLVEEGEPVGQGAGRETPRSRQNLGRDGHDHPDGPPPCSLPVKLTPHFDAMPDCTQCSWKPPNPDSGLESWRCGIQDDGPQEPRT